MKASELPILAERLKSLAEYFDRKPPTTAALRIWLDALGECHSDDVAQVLSTWAQSHGRMPTADQVLALCRVKVSERIESVAKHNRAMTADIGTMAAALRENMTPEARQAREELRRMSAGRQSMGPKAWAYRLKQCEEAGEKLNDVQRAAWRQALGHAETESESEREERLEREAIQAE